MQISIIQPDYSPFYSKSENSQPLIFSSLCKVANSSYKAKMATMQSGTLEGGRERKGKRDNGPNFICVASPSIYQATQTRFLADDPYKYITFSA